MQVCVIGKGELHGNPQQTCVPTDRQTESGEGEKDGGLRQSEARMTWSNGRKHAR